MNPVSKTRRIRALLEDGRAAIRIAHLPPAHTSNFAIRPSAGGHLLVGDQRLVVAKVSIGKTKQRPLAKQKIKSIGGIWLWDTVASSTAQSQNRVKWHRWQRVSQGKR